MEPKVQCDHEWVLILAEESWSGPRRTSVCSLCHAMLREYLPSSADARRPSSSAQVSGDYVRHRVPAGAAQGR